MQRLLSQAVWDVDGVRDEIRAFVLEGLGRRHVIAAIDETSFLKRGNHSAGVSRQYCGSTGDVRNCQVGVFLSLITPFGHSLIDRELYVPQQWTDDPARCRQAGIPETLPFQTKPQLAILMLERLSQAQVCLDWVVADSVYGGNLELRTWLESRKLPYVMAVACVPVWHQGCDDGWHSLLIRRPLDSSQELTYYLVFSPPGTPLFAKVTALGARWRIEEDFENGKDLGLDHYEVRSWVGWYRHITLVMLALAFLTNIALEARKPSTALLPAWPPSAEAVLSTALCSLSVPEARRLLARLLFPPPTSVPLVFAWSWWRRKHQQRASFFHTRRRLKAG